MRILTLISMLALGIWSSARPQTNNRYPWLSYSTEQRKCIQDIPTPDGYKRAKYPLDSQQNWLRHLPLKEGSKEVRLFDGSLKSNQRAQHRIVDIDVGSRDLQQCADVIIRLRAEYLYSRRLFDQIAFNFTSGDRATFSSWARGIRPIIQDNKVSWKRLANQDRSYASFRKYLEVVFTYAGSYSLYKELRRITDVEEIQVGDVFLQGGFPGHGVIVVDLARKTSEDATIFMLAQSYMPAQDMHVLINPLNPSLSPWYELKSVGLLATPEWTFQWSDLMRFPPE